MAALIIAFYIFKGLGCYFSAYLMADIGQRVVRDLRNLLQRHILGQSASFFAHRATGQLLSRVTNDVGQVQHAVSETIGDLLQESLALVGYAALLFYYDAGLALVCLTGAPLIVYPLAQLGKRLRRTTRRSQEALEHLSHVSTEAFTGHRIVKALRREEREAEKFEAASQRLYRTNMIVTRIVSILPPLMELLGGMAIAVALWYGSQANRGRAADARGVHVVHRRAAADVRPGQEVEPGERQPAAGDRGGRAHLRGARRAHGGAGATRRAGTAAVPGTNRIPRTWCSRMTTASARPILRSVS